MKDQGKMVFPAIFLYMLLVKEKGLNVSFSDNVRRWSDKRKLPLICSKMKFVKNSHNGKRREGRRFCGVLVR